MRKHLADEIKSDIKKKEAKIEMHNYGEKMFKGLYNLFVFIGFLVLIYSIFIVNFVLIGAAIQLILFSYAFKFMESAILLLKDIRKQLQINPDK